VSNRLTVNQKKTWKREKQQAIKKQLAEKKFTKRRTKKGKNPSSSNIFSKREANLA